MDKSLSNQFERTEQLIGCDAQQKLHNSHVAVFGLGGVGGYTVEALARAGVGTLTLVDFDTVDVSNLNRQILATHYSLGFAKAEMASARVWQINPQAQVFARTEKFDQTTLPNFDFSTFDYVVDAIDTVTSKLLLVEACAQAHTPIVSCMGTGNKLDATAFRVADISQTSVCPLAKVMRRELKKRGIDHLKVVYSAEPPISPQQDDAAAQSAANAVHTKQTPASISFVPPVAGMILAGEVIKDIIKQ